MIFFEGTINNLQSFKRKKNDHFLKMQTISLILSQSRKSSLFLRGAPPLLLTGHCNADTFGHQMLGFFPPIKEFSTTPAGYPVHANSVSPWRQHQLSQVKSSVPARLMPCRQLQMPISSHTSSPVFLTYQL